MKKSNKTLERRFTNSLNFLHSTSSPPARILDLGTPNELGRRIQSAGYEVQNTEGDLESVESIGEDADVVTAFEILEHLVSPYNVLRAIKAPRLVATVPLRLWFAKAYRNPSDPWDRHFHEFEDWQFDWLLEHAGWKIVRTEKWTSYGSCTGIRPLLRRFTPRYYAVEAIR
ncbi:MAG: methyltransferase [Bacteroidetes bacterium]|nr:methyltransferase [Bacteroidota bacterium]MCY4204136.1 methyltransferase [Bacteroidota bacterium]